MKIKIFPLGGFGSTRSIMDSVFKFDGSWKKIGTLLNPRFGHRSIVNNNSIIHIGGNQLQYVTAYGESQG